MPTRLPLQVARVHIMGVGYNVINNIIVITLNCPIPP